jgi:predicted phage terminase large subunit-like protein
VTLDKLKALYSHCRANKNYQHKGMSDDEFDIRAKKSWDRLTNEAMDKVRKMFALATGVDLTKSPAELKTITRCRYLAQTNLFFLCHLLEKYKDMSEKEHTWIDGTVHNTHEEICNDFFVHKDPTVKKFKDFAIKYIGQKERLLLVPRGGFKSSMNMADCVQWIICHPEVTILVMTGVLDLAKDFVGEIKKFFTLEQGVMEGDPEASKKPHRPVKFEDGTFNMFQVIFPEHCIPQDDGKAYEYQTPYVVMTDKECTVFAASIDQNLSGWHTGVQKLDDVVTNENSRTVERIRNINKQVSINNAMLMPYGFYDKIGTFYDIEDTYGQDIKIADKRKKDGKDQKMKIYLRPAMWPNAFARAAGKVEEEMVESDWELWFNEPGQLTYEFLLGKMDDPEGFAIKYLNDPTKAHRVKFPRELLIRRTIPSHQLPQQGMVVTTVDTAYSTKSWADYTVIMTALIYGGRFYILDMKRGRYNEYELPGVIAANALQWKPKRICIEDSVGVKWLGKEVYREMERLKIRVPIEFVPLGQGSAKNAKNMKAKPVVRYLGDERLLFANQCNGLEELYNELEKFDTAAATHDDIVSALSILVEQFGSYAEMEGRMSAASPDFVADPKQKAAYDQIYGQGSFSKQWNAAHSETGINNLDMTLPEGYKVEQQDSLADYDPLADLF